MIGQQLQSISRLYARYRVTQDHEVFKRIQSVVLSVPDAEIEDFLRQTIINPVLRGSLPAFNIDLDDERVLVHPMEQFISATMSIDNVILEWKHRLGEHLAMLRDAPPLDILDRRTQFYVSGLNTAKELRRNGALTMNVQTIRDIRLPFDAVVAGEQKRMKLPKTALKYAAYLKDKKASISDLVFVVLNMNWIEVFHSHQLIINRVREYDMIDHVTINNKGEREQLPRFDIGKSGRNIFSHASGVLLLPLIETFFVVRHSDLNSLRRMHLASFFINTICRSFNNNRVALNDTQGPLVQRATVPAAGWGLFARADYDNNAIICNYGGVKMSQDVNYSFQTDQEIRLYGSAYTVALKREKSDAVEDDWIIDGKLFWSLYETGRFINQASTPQEVNCRFVESASAKLKGSAAKLASTKSIVIYTTRKVKAGEEFLCSYGTEFHPAFLWEGFVPFQNCIQCKTMPITAKCGNKCGEALYCSQNCADSDWLNHKTRCK